MLNIGTRVKIAMTEELKKMRLSDIAGRRAAIQENLNDDGRINKGYIVKLDCEYLGEESWFVPAESVLKCND